MEAGGHRAVRMRPWRLRSKFLFLNQVKGGLITIAGSWELLLASWLTPRPAPIYTSQAFWTEVLCEVLEEKPLVSPVEKLSKIGAAMLV